MVRVLWVLQEGLYLFMATVVGLVGRLRPRGCLAVAAEGVAVLGTWALVVLGEWVEVGLAIILLMGLLEALLPEAVVGVVPGLRKWREHFLDLAALVGTAT